MSTSSNPKTTPKVDENLVDIEQAPKPRSPGKDLNAKLMRLESRMAGIDKRIGNTDKRLLSLHQETEASDDEIADSVAQAHERLESLQTAYTQLIKHSEKLAKDADKLSRALATQHEQTIATLDAQEQRLNGVVADQSDALNEKIKASAKVAKQRADAIAAVQDSLQNEHNAHQARTEKLEIRATQLAESLESRIAGVNATITTMESRFKKELADYAKASKARDQELDEKIDRAAEKNTTAITVLTTEVNRRTKVLAENVKSAHDNIGKLFGRANKLQEQNAEQQTQIYNLLGMSQRMFRWGIGSLLALVLAIVAVTYYQDSRWQQQETNNFALAGNLGDQALQVQNNTTALNSLNEQQTVQDAMLAGTAETINDKLATHGKGFVVLTEVIDTKFADYENQLATMKQKLATVEDRSDSATGRLNAISPLSQFGDNGTIHGPQWLASQDANSYVVELASVANKNVLYQLADRRSFYLQESLSYVITGTGEEQRYRLIYGPFANEQAATKVADDLPPIDGRNAPTVKALKQIL